MGAELCRHMVAKMLTKIEEKITGGATKRLLKWVKPGLPLALPTSPFPDGLPSAVR